MLRGKAVVSVQAGTRSRTREMAAITSILDTIALTSP